MATKQRLPLAHQPRFDEGAGLIEQFGQQHLDAELTEFALELWTRICRRRSPDCLSGKPAVWAASVCYVIARMNFLFDRSEPAHLSAETICDFFQTKKRTVSTKATEIERRLRLRRFEPGLCRSVFLEIFAQVRLPNGIILPWEIARRLGYVPADARVEDFL
ncbi:hypothetical protein BH20VER3_BH20VER3_04040 [soil metagenome]